MAADHYNARRRQECKQLIQMGSKQVENRRMRGFERASGLVAGRIRTASESRGFAVSRLLTHWAEVAGADIARIARPVEVTYGRGFGATLTLLTTGANAPMVEMQKDRLREKVNACYGYAAIQKIRITQTAPTGFAEGRAVFEDAPKPVANPAPITGKASEAVRAIGDDGLKEALARLGANILKDSNKGKVSN